MTHRFPVLSDKSMTHGSPPAAGGFSYVIKFRRGIMAPDDERGENLEK